LAGEKEPQLKNYYLITGAWGGSIGIRLKDQSRVNEMIEIANTEILTGFPDTRAFAQQGSLFGRFAAAGSISIDLQSADFNALGQAAISVSDLVESKMPGGRVNLRPDPQIVTPELRLIPNDRKLAEVGLSRESYARTLRAFGDGLWLGEFFHEQSRLDIFLRADEWSKPEQLENIPIVTPSGAVIPFGELAQVERGVGPNQIYRLGGSRTISVGINPPAGMALSEATKVLSDLEPQIRQLLPLGSSMAFGGDADSLGRAISNLSGNFLLAVLLLFFVMAALFKSIQDSLIVMISLPMAAVGGIVAVRVIDMITPTPLDLLGMIGFIILLGLVVNNAILLVAETRRQEEHCRDRHEAVHAALKNRIRPILMSTSTSLMGMLPLVVAPGAGSVIYKGLATVIVGGMSVSTLFTLILLPCLLQISRPQKDYIADRLNQFGLRKTQ